MIPADTAISMRVAEGTTTKEFSWFTGGEDVLEMCQSNNTSSSGLCTWHGRLLNGPYVCKAAINCLSICYRFGAISFAPTEHKRPGERPDGAGLTCGVGEAAAFTAQAVSAGGCAPTSRMAAGSTG